MVVFTGHVNVEFVAFDVRSLAVKLSTMISGHARLTAVSVISVSAGHNCTQDVTWWLQRRHQDIRFAVGGI